jgi:hypothetical protein
MTEDKWAHPPLEVTVHDFLFSGRIAHLLPTRDEIPEEFWNYKNPYSQFVGKWFFSGIRMDELRAKPGIDWQTGVRHLKAILNSFEPAHEHKTAGAAYLLSRWFTIALPTPPKEPKPKPRPKQEKNDVAWPAQQTKGDKSADRRKKAQQAQQAAIARTLKGENE